MSIDWSVAVTVILFMIVHLCGTVWWMSKIQTTLTILTAQVSVIASKVESYEAVYVKKEDFARELAHLEKQVDAQWRKFDKHVEGHA